MDVDGGSSSRWDKDNLVDKRSPAATARIGNDSENDNSSSDDDKPDTDKDLSQLDSDYEVEKEFDDEIDVDGGLSSRLDEDSQVGKSCPATRVVRTVNDSDNNSNSSDDDNNSLDDDEQDTDKGSSPRQMTTIGTAATIGDIVYCCIYTSAACAMRHNKRGLRVIDGKTCAGPLTDKSLGLTLRTRPTPLPNRALDATGRFLCDEGGGD